MVAIAGVSPFILWGGFITIIAVFLLIDLGLFNKKNHTISVKEALIWTLIWFSLAMVFNAFILYEFGKDAALKFFTGYLIEKSLSVDNLFVILLIFTSFKVDPKYQHRILFWGIVGAIFMRGALILLGSAIVSRFEWVLYLFGFFLIYSGVMIFAKKEEEDFNPHDTFVVKTTKKLFRVSNQEPDGRFLVKEKGRTALTIFFIALLVIEVSDVVFAFDSIPAIFGITTDPFIVFTSNIFAILGLRSLYFVILKANKYFAYLPMGLAVILIFIGIKMLVEGIIHISIMLSLATVGIILMIYMLASLFMLPKGYKAKSVAADVEEE